jgi:hypothetical protein
MTFDGQREVIPRRAVRRRFNNRNRRKKASQQASGLLATIDPLEKLQRQSAVAGHRLEVESTVVELPDWDAPIPLLVSVARREVREAIYRTDVTTWTALLGNELTTQAKERLNDDLQANVWACIVTGNAKATPAEGRTVDLAGWGQAVSLRFEISMARDPRMGSWVERLDKHDHQAALIETLRATQGVRAALLTVAVAVLGVLPVEFLLVHVT